MLSNCRCFLLLFWSIVLVSSSKEVKKKPKCDIVSPYLSPYVSAYLSHLTEGKGCSTNETSPNKQAVHVINLKVSQELADGKPAKVNLKIEQLSSKNSDLNIYNDYGRPLVFVLNSDKPVKWKVELSRIGQAIDNIKHLFVIPSHSSIRFKKSLIKVRGRKMSLQNYGNKSDLVKWARRRFKALTTYSETEGTSLIFRVGWSADVGNSCDLSNLQLSPHIMTSHKQPQSINGCTTQGRRHYLSKPVYIIELQQSPLNDTKAESVVEIDITSFNNEPLTKDFYLILKSPPNIKWKIRSRKIQGWIEIVTDAEADLKGIRMQTVASRREVMKSSGEKLIQWVEKYIAAVESYISIKTANQIKLLLHSEKGVRVGQTSMPSYHELDTEEDRNDLHDIIHTDCSRGKFTVSFPKFLLQEWTLVKEQISLLDKSCGPRQNETHIILESDLNDCNTRHLQIDDNIMYSNAIVIHAAEDPDSLSDVGSGGGRDATYNDQSDMSGAGNNLNTHIDDEDFQSRKVEIDVQCERPTQEPTEKPDSILSDQSDYRIELYTSESFTEPVVLPTQFTANKRLYLQASITSDIPLKVQFENCWLSPANSENKVGTSKQLIENGCRRDDNLKWHDLNIPGRTNLPTHLTPYSRFSFVLTDYFQDQDMYLYCELSQCLMHFSIKGIDIPKCTEDTPQERCQKQLPLPGLETGSSTRAAANHEVLKIGPLVVKITHTGDTSGTSEQTTVTSESRPQQSVIIEGLDSATVVGIAFAAFAIGILLTGTLWFIHTHTGQSKHVLSSHGSTETTGEISPNAQVPMSA